jgi:hypothetical protein
MNGFHAGLLVRIQGLSSETSRRYNGRVGRICRVIDGSLELKLIPDSKELKLKQEKACHLPDQTIAQSIRLFERADSEGDINAFVTTCNQLAGYFKGIGLYEEALQYYVRWLWLAENAELPDSVKRQWQVWYFSNHFAFETVPPCPATVAL